MGTSPGRGLGELCPSAGRPAGLRTGIRLAGPAEPSGAGRVASLSRPPPSCSCSCHFEGPPRTEQGGHCGSSPDRAVNWET